MDVHKPITWTESGKKRDSPASYLGHGKLGRDNKEVLENMLAIHESRREQSTRSPHVEQQFALTEGGASSSSGINNAGGGRRLAMLRPVEQRTAEYNAGVRDAVQFFQENGLFLLNENSGFQ